MRVKEGGKGWGERETDRQTDTQTDRDRQTEIEGEREGKSYEERVECSDGMQERKGEGGRE